ncbi:MAG: hypothetical protein P1U56_21790 [Saprospiraceae bacterium]|nr:hypothetical protein [Saprospiraceae bacterium]MDF1698499.1 hypothetical protein [Saprospiraceae bacterium]
MSITNKEKEILDNQNNYVSPPNEQKRYSILSAINAFLTIIFGLSFVLILYNSMMGLSASEEVLIYISKIFSILSITGVLFTLLSFIKNEGLTTLKWIAGFINALFFMLFLFNFLRGLF